MIVTVSKAADFECDYVLKIAILGAGRDARPGVTSFFNRYLQDNFNPEEQASVGSVVDNQNIVISGLRKDDVQVQLRVCALDKSTAGRVLNSGPVSQSETQGSVGYIFVYDITNKESWVNLQKYIRRIKESDESGSVVCLLVGNKADLRHLRQVSTDEGVSFAEEHNMSFLEVSALENLNVTKTFTTITSEIIKPILLSELKSKLQSEINAIETYLNKRKKATRNFLPLFGYTQGDYLAREQSWKTIKGLINNITESPRKLDAMLDADIARFSGGRRQDYAQCLRELKVAIAREQDDANKPGTLRQRQ